MSGAPAKKTIGSLLVEYGFITEDDLLEGLEEQKASGKRLGEALVEMGKISHQDIEWILSKQLDIPFVIVDESSLDRELIQKFQKDFLLKNRIIPIYETPEELAIVTDDPFNRQAFESIEENFEKSVNLSAGNGEQIDELLRKIFKQEGVPELMARVEKIIRKIEGTSFYRLDFHLLDYALEIFVFGSGILRSMGRLRAGYGREDVLRTMDILSIPYLLLEYPGSMGHFLSIVPLGEPVEISGHYPSVLGSYGLGKPGEIAFADARPFGVEGLYYSPSPVPGYRYLSLLGTCRGYDLAVYAIDSAPEGFGGYYVNLHQPRTCRSCAGNGCEKCNELGLQFRKVEGIYSHKDLNRLSLEA